MSSKVDSEVDYDLIFIGPSLASSLSALSLKELRPDLKILIIEDSPLPESKSESWSFFDSDIPFILKSKVDLWGSLRWPEVNVCFPKIHGPFPMPYYTFTASILYKKIREKFGAHFRTGEKLKETAQKEITLMGGERIKAHGVFDGREFQWPKSPLSAYGYKKFLSLFLSTHSPHGLSAPVVMDALCPQLEGFRYFQCIPLAAQELLIQETYFSLSSEIYEERWKRSLLAYASNKNWAVKEVIGRKQDILPIPLNFHFWAPWYPQEVFPIGYKGGFFNSATASEAPDTLHFAADLSQIKNFSAKSVQKTYLRRRKKLYRRQNFYWDWNRMHFFAHYPLEQYKAFENIFQKSPKLRQRFFASQITRIGKLRLLFGQPNLPFSKIWNRPKADEIAQIIPKIKEPVL